MLWCQLSWVELCAYGWRHMARGCSSDPEIESIASILQYWQLAGFLNLITRPLQQIGIMGITNKFRISIWTWKCYLVRTLANWACSRRLKRNMSVCIIYHRAIRWLKTNHALISHETGLLGNPARGLSELSHFKATGLLQKGMHLLFSIDRSKSPVNIVSIML
jgi:hypothetical protein